MSITSTRRKFVAVVVVALACVSFSLFSAGRALGAAADVPDDLRDEITGLNSEVQRKKRQLDELQSKAEQYRRVIAEKKLESATIEDQIALLDSRIATTGLDIEIAEQEIKAYELEIAVLGVKIADQEVHVARDRELLASLMRTMHRLRFGQSPFEALLSHRSFSSFFDEVHQVARVQSGVKRTLDDVRKGMLALARERGARDEKRISVEERKRSLEAARIELEDEQNLKHALLAATQESELEYRYLLADLKREQNDADSEIVYLEKALRDRLDLADRLGKENAVLSWPVVPTRGISAKFHDPDYPFRNVFEHPAIDIRAAQGTPVRAAAAGIVARAKDAGLGYSYVMLLHNSGLSTVYGHLSRVTAREDTFVERGEIIGYSGGAPGTPGAGRLTTGPHLHFETRISGIPADPLRYLVAP